MNLILGGSFCVNSLLYMILKLFKCLLDMKDERTLLMTHAVPILQDYCSELGLQFQFIDLHWCHRGADHVDRFSKLAEKEIKDCQRFSIAPCFVVSSEFLTRLYITYVCHTLMVNSYKKVFNSQRI